MAKNRGPLLLGKAKGLLQAIPIPFLASVKLKKTEQGVPNGTEATVPVATSTGVLQSEIEITNTNEDRAKEVSLDSNVFPTLTGQKYDPALGIKYAFTEKVGASGTLATTEQEVDPLSNVWEHSLSVDAVAFRLAAADVYLSFPSRSTLQLPPVLKSLSVIWDESSEEGTYESNFDGSSSGHSVSLSGGERGECHSTAQAVPAWVVEMEELWASNIVTESHFFLLPYPVTTTAILAKIQAKMSYSPAVALWPAFKPKSHVLTAFGQSIKVSSQVDAHASHSETVGESVSESVTTGKGGSTSVATNAVTLRLPACLHDTITVDESKSLSVTAQCDVGWGGMNFPTVAVNQTRTSSAIGSAEAALTATSPIDIPRTGYYLIDSKVEIFQYGLAKVYAEVLNASIFA